MSCKVHQRRPDSRAEVLVYRHKETGALRYVGRPDLPVDDAQSRYEKLLQDLLELETSPASRRRDERLAALLEHCNQLVEASVLPSLAGCMPRAWLPVCVVSGGKPSRRSDA